MSQGYTINTKHRRINQGDWNQTSNIQENKFVRNDQSLSDSDDEYVN